MRRLLISGSLIAALAVALRRLLKDAGSRGNPGDPATAPSSASGESREPNGPADLSRKQLYQQAKDLQIPGRSKMNRDELARALEEREGERPS
jgi:DNA end-binding protein Ku